MKGSDRNILSFHVFLAAGIAGESITCGAIAGWFFIVGGYRLWRERKGSER